MWQMLQNHVDPRSVHQRWCRQTSISPGHVWPECSDIRCREREKSCMCELVLTADARFKMQYLSKQTSDVYRLQLL